MNESKLRLRGPADARSVALLALSHVRQKEMFVREALDQELQAHPLPSADRRLATNLVYGVLRRRATLEALLQPCLSRPSHNVEPWLRDALQLGAFQLAFLSHVPAHAAIYETVELANRVGLPRAKGFLNGVLRAVSRLLSDEVVEVPSSTALPVGRSRHRRTKKVVLPDPIKQPAEYLAEGFSLPKWLVVKWLERFGWESCLQLGEWSIEPAPMWLRCNPLRCSRDEAILALTPSNIGAEVGEPPQSLRLLESMPVRDLPHWNDGWFSVQDVSAMRAASALKPRPGSRVLDLCAAPGSKSCHLAELMRNKGEIVACDTDAGRLQTLTSACQRLGIEIVTLHPLEEGQDPPQGPFDAILVDVPCSNTGVLARRPEVRWRLRPVDLEHLVPLQTKLLLQACERLKPGGRLVYSTCSVEPEENQGVVKAVLKAMRHMKLDAEEEQHPGRPSDGGYWARLKSSG